RPDHKLRIGTASRARSLPAMLPTCGTSFDTAGEDRMPTPMGAVRDCARVGRAAGSRTFSYGLKPAPAGPKWKRFQFVRTRNSAVAVAPWGSPVAVTARCPGGASAGIVTLRLNAPAAS